jgi:hypothetical protein
MAKIVLFSVIIMMFAIPIAAARVKNPRRGFNRLVVAALLFNLFYLFAVRYIYPRLL